MSAPSRPLSGRPPEPASPRREALLWLALLAAFSPVLVELGRGLRSDLVPASSLLPPLLVAICLRRGVGRRGTPARDGVALLVAGAGLELAGLATGSWTVALAGLPVAVVGMARWLGRPSVPVALLGLGIVPVPDSLLDLRTPVPESALLGWVCDGVRALGPAIHCVGPTATAGDRTLEIFGSDVGLPLAVVLAELGWFSALYQGRDWRGALRRGVLFAAAALAIQPAAIAVALLLLAAGSEPVARAWLSHGAWLACAVATAAWALAGPRPPDSSSSP